MKDSGVEWLGKIPAHWGLKGKLQNGDLILTVRGTIGSVAIFDQTEHSSGFINAQMMIVRPRTATVTSGFLYQLMTGGYWIEGLELSAYGTAQQQLSNEVLRNQMIALPPKGEQRDIPAQLKERTTDIDLLTGKIRQAIQKLVEYRAALISAAVTGKIDVRDQK